ncbi:CoA transferase [Candidatus Bathyarchaeota archaeon]|nr:CoA transferase [Candidatus Bathyarchaeota archaeon]MBS7631132.1 CoA transferase [Candidatus Bathyarchaeota archaeon]
MSKSVSNPPLKGVRIIDLSRVLAGPFCSMILSELGAEVIKVEMPELGDDTRAYPPFINGESSYFLSINRGKKSVTLDLKKKEAREVLYRLVKKSDVLLENFRPGVTKRLGVDYETIHEINPRLIYCSISSFGQSGPYADWPGYDLIVQGMGGLMGITGEPNGPPVRVGVAITDIGAGMWAAIAILAALMAREHLNAGQYIDVSMLDGSVSWMTYVAGNYFATGNVPPRMGSAHPSIVPYQSFEASDGKHILIAAGNDRLWSLLCDGMDLQELKNDPLYASADKRVENRVKLVSHLESEFKKKTRDEWLERLRSIGFPCGPVYTIDEIFKDPHILQRRMLIEMNHKKAGKIKQIGPVIKFSESSCIVEFPPPILGEHTEEVLKEIAEYSTDEIEKLRKIRAI